MILTAYKNRLEQSGYVVQPAVDGLEALKWLHQSPPDLILLDLMLPKFSGEEVLKYINSSPALGLIPVIVLSTNSILTAVNEPFVRQTDKQLLKHDCTFAKLLAAIEELLAGEKESANAGQKARSFKAAHEAARFAGGSAVQTPNNSAVREIRQMLQSTPVVCAWTDRINIDGKWMRLTEFLSERLHLNVSHGISPEGLEKILRAK